MGSLLSTVSGSFSLQTSHEVAKPSLKVPLLHRPTSLSGSHDEMTQAVRFVDAAQRGEAKN